jgi:hypothetical protein
MRIKIAAGHPGGAWSQSKVHESQMRERHRKKGDTWAFQLWVFVPAIALTLVGKERLFS